MDKYQAFINNILNKYKEWCKMIDKDCVGVADYEECFYMEEQAIIHLHDLNNKKNIEIAKLIMEVNALKEHIDCLENSPFRRIYNWITGVVKYRVKVVKIGGNK